MTLATTIMGLSITAAPMACAGAGACLFVALVLWHAALACLSCHLLLQVSQIASEKAWVPIGEAAAGVAGRYIAAVVLMLQTSTALTTYVVLVKTMGVSTVAQIVNGEAAEASEAEKVLSTVGVVIGLLLPLCLLKDIRTLSFSSYVSLCVYLAVAITTVASATWSDKGFLGKDAQDDLHAAFRAFKPEGGYLGVLRKLPYMIFPFGCHHTLMPVYSGLRDGTPAKMTKVSAAGFSVASFLYLLVGIGGYCAFRNYLLEENVDKILDCFPESIGFKLLRMCVLAAVLCSFPIIHFGTRKVLYSVIWGPNMVWSLKKHIVATLLIVGFVTSVALIAKDLNVVFKWAGATVTPTMMMVYPAATYLRCWRQLPADAWTACRVRASWFVLVWGLLVMVVCVAVNLDHDPVPKRISAALEGMFSE